MIEHTYQIKNEKHVTRYFENRKLLVVNKFRYSHSKARSITRRMVGDGLLECVDGGDCFILKIKGGE